MLVGEQRAAVEGEDRQQRRLDLVKHALLLRFLQFRAQNLLQLQRDVRVLRGQAERVARELRADGLAAARLTLKVRFTDFQTITRAVTAEPTQDGLELYRRAHALLENEPLEQPVRLIGLSASSLGPACAGQLSLLDPAALRREKLARVVDGLARRFGDDVVRPASLLPPPEAC